MKMIVDGEQGDRAMEIADGGPTPEEILCESERRATLRQAIAKLRENLRVVVLHRELQGLTNAETARCLGLTVSAVKARGIHARRFLRKILNATLRNPRPEHAREKGITGNAERSFVVESWACERRHLVVLRAGLVYCSAGKKLSPVRFSVPLALRQARVATCKSLR